MNHLRRMRPRRFWLLIPVALLGAALLLRARLPRPQTESDKWLWEQGEEVSSVSIGFERGGRDLARQFGIPDSCYVRSEERQGIRTVLRAVQGVTSFIPSPKLTAPAAQKLERGSILWINVGGKDNLYLTPDKQGYRLYRKDTHEVATIGQQGFTRLQDVLSEIIAKASQPSGRWSPDGYYVVCHEVYY